MTTVESEPGENLADEGPASEETDEPQPAAPKPLPEHVEDCDGSWLYTLQHPLEPDPKSQDPAKVRVTKRVYARHVLEAAKGNPKTRAEGVFAMACALTKLPADVLRRLDLRDYEVVCSLCDRSGTPDATTHPR